MEFIVTHHEIAPNVPRGLRPLAQYSVIADTAEEARRIILRQYSGFRANAEVLEVAAVGTTSEGPVIYRRKAL